MRRLLTTVVLSLTLGAGASLPAVAGSSENNWATLRDRRDVVSRQWTQRPGRGLTAKRRPSDPAIGRTQHDSALTRHPADLCRRGGSRE